MSSILTLFFFSLITLNKYFKELIRHAKMILAGNFLEIASSFILENFKATHLKTIGNYFENILPSSLGNRFNNYFVNYKADPSNFLGIFFANCLRIFPSSVFYHSVILSAVSTKNVWKLLQKLLHKIHFNISSELLKEIA